MNIKSPKISIGLPVYNGEKYIRKAVLSILSQTFNDWELIIIDDASNDHGLNRIGDLVDPRIKITKNPYNIGLAATLNKAVHLSNGIYFARMDQDDICHPLRLELQYSFLIKNDCFNLVGSKCILLDSDSKCKAILEYPEHHDDICRRPWRGILLPHPTWMGRTQWFKENPYKVPGPYYCEDQELLLRTYHNSRFAILPAVLFAYRVRETTRLNKIIQTRITLSTLQLKNFIKKRNITFALIAFLTCCAKCIHDVIGPINGKSYRLAYGGVKLSAIPHELKGEWEKIIKEASIK